MRWYFDTELEDTIAEHSMFDYSFIVGESLVHISIAEVLGAGTFVVEASAKDASTCVFVSFYRNEM